jgi:hypothetical protein
MRGGGGELLGLSQLVQLYTGAQLNFGDLIPYLSLTYDNYHSLHRNLSTSNTGSTTEATRRELTLLDRPTSCSA